MYVREWNNLQYASAAAFLLAVYSDSLSAANAKLTCPEGQIPPQELLDFARSQVLKGLTTSSLSDHSIHILMIIIADRQNSIFPVHHYLHLPVNALC